MTIIVQDLGVILKKFNALSTFKNFKNEPEKGDMKIKQNP
jgi:hypothetical protein